MVNFSFLSPYGIALLLLFSPAFARFPLECFFDQQGMVISDNGRLYKAHPSEYYQPQTLPSLEQTIHLATEKGKKISFAGQRHSQGGQSFCEGDILVDMRSLNQILRIDPVAKIAVVQPGVTWEGLQNALNPYNLAVKVMQSSNIFTIGGSLSVNAHGRDCRFGTLIDTVRSIKIMKADGQIVNASRTENRDLFRAAIGGYGLFGAIVEAELELTDNVTYRKQAKVMSIEKYPTYFQTHVLGKAEVGLHFARMRISKKHFLKELIAVSYLEDSRTYCNPTLEPEENVLRNKAELFLLRNFEAVRGLKWAVEVRVEKEEEILTRNQAMRPPIKCLDYNSKTHTDILQEYFIPITQFQNFAEKLRKIADHEEINLLNITIRYVPKDTLTLLPYAKEDSFAFVLFLNQGLSKKEREKAARWTRQLIDAALACHGTYYLPYQRYATPTQFYKAYPEVPSFLQIKQTYDPQTRFSNAFYQAYFTSPPTAP
ncbi:MAG: FAD-binding oxidoreductase [Candidatus Doudnabacteria bacterium]|nr:FAD-binding oxidoreductase [Candidatus Doudnabacteria bacterium]